MPAWSASERSTFAQEPPPSVEYCHSVCTSSPGSAFHVKSATAFIGRPSSSGMANGSLSSHMVSMLFGSICASVSTALPDVTGSSERSGTLNGTDTVFDAAE